MRRVRLGFVVALFAIGAAAGLAFRAAIQSRTFLETARAVRVVPRLAVKPGTPRRVTLPGEVSDVCVGGSGRYLFLYVPSRRQVAVFDAREGTVARLVPVQTDRGLVAAGARRLFVVDSESLAVERFRLDDFSGEASATLPLTDRLQVAALGSASEGPLVVGIKGGRDSLSPVRFLDPDTLSELRLPVTGRDSLSGDYVYRIEVSRDGGLLGAWRLSVSPTGLISGVVADEGVEMRYEHDSAGWLLPAPDGRTLFSTEGILTADLMRVPAGVKGLIPAASGSFAIVLPDAAGWSREPKQRVSVIDLTSQKPFYTFTGVEGLGQREDRAPELPVYKRAHLFPGEGYLVTLSEKADGLFVYPFDLGEALRASGIDYLYVASEPPRTFEPGRDWSYSMDVRSKGDDFSVELLSGPSGMTLSGKGVLQWNPPPGAGGPVTVIVSVRDGTGQSLHHVFELRPKRG